jgi:TRAP-type mannitol/chloroaromatic compound transport system substrate-binding protein
VVNVPGGKIIDVLRTGAIDAAEWAGPGTDMALGLHEVAKYYYYPTFQEPGVAYTCGINKGVWEEFSAAEQSLIASAAAAENSFSLAEINADNADALVRLKAEHPDALRRFDDETLRGLREASAKVLAERMSGDPLRERIYQSFLAFREKASAWSDVADRAYLSARSLG